MILAVVSGGVGGEAEAKCYRSRLMRPGGNSDSGFECNLFADTAS